MRATTTGIFIRNTSGMPGITQVFRMRTVGHFTSSVVSSEAPSGMSAMRRWPAVQRFAVVVAEHLFHDRRDDDRDAERAGDGLDRDVVVRRADAARGEEPVVRGGELAHLAGDFVDLVQDRHHAAELDAERAERPREDGDVRLLDLAGQELVADDERRGGLGARSVGRPYVHPASITPDSRPGEGGP